MNMITPRVLEAKALADKHIYLKFKDGKEKIYDMNPLIEKIKYYEKLKEDSYFELIKPRGVSVEWPNGEDVCPENLYYDSVDYEDWKKTDEMIKGS